MLCALAVFQVSSAFAACTAEQFQQELVSMQQSMAEVGKDQDKMSKLSAELESLFADELKEFTAMTQEVNGKPTPEGAQALLDKGCELYKKMNVKIAEFK
jgi:hypothetical protein